MKIFDRSCWTFGRYGAVSYSALAELLGDIFVPNQFGKGEQKRRFAPAGAVEDFSDSCRTLPIACVDSFADPTGGKHAGLLVP